MDENRKGLRWRSIAIFAVVSAVILGASIVVSLTVAQADSTPARGTYPALVLKGKLTKRIPWAKLPTSVVWDGRKDKDNRHKELQAVFRGETLYKLIGLVDDANPKTFNVAKAKRGYGIKFIAKDGYTYTMDSRRIVGKTKWIIAKLKNGKPLPAAEGPYRHVGPFVGFLAAPSVKMLVRIELIFK